MRIWWTRAKGARRRGFIWIPRGPLGIALFFVLLILVLGLLMAAATLLLAAAVAAAVVLAAVQAGKTLLSGSRGRASLPEVDGRFLDRGGSPLEHYLTLVEEFDRLTAKALALDVSGAASWRAMRGVRRLIGRAAALREHAIAVERDASSDAGIEAARPGLWELIVAATDLVRYLSDLLAYADGGGRSTGLRDLAGLLQRRGDLEARRDGLVRRLQETDLRATRRAARG